MHGLTCCPGAPPLLAEVLVSGQIQLLHRWRRMTPSKQRTFMSMGQQPQSGEETQGERDAGESRARRRIALELGTQEGRPIDLGSPAAAVSDRSTPRTGQEQTGRGKAKPQGIKGPGAGKRGLGAPPSGIKGSRSSGASSSDDEEASPGEPGLSLMERLEQRRCEAAISGSADAA